MPRLVSDATRAECIRLRLSEKMSTPKIARRVGISNCAAYKILRKHPWTGKRSHLREWTPAELETLRRLWPTADEAEIVAALPGRNFDACARKACSLRIRRPSPTVRKGKRFILPLIRALRAERERQGLTRPVLAAKAGYHYNQICGWENGKVQPALLYVVEWAAALGFDIVLQKPWDGSSEITQDPRRMKAGR